MHYLARVSNDRLFTVRKLGQIVPLKFAVQRHFHLLRIDQNKLQLRRMALINERRENNVGPTDSTTSGTGHQQVRHFREIDHEHFVGDSLAQCNRKFLVRFREAWRAEYRTYAHHFAILVRHLDTNRSLTRDRRNNADAQR